jgi:hypothetical protein
VEGSLTHFSQSKFAASVQNLVSKRREEAGLYLEIVEKFPLLDRGWLLDIGTGSGLQRKVIRETWPKM